VTDYHSFMPFLQIAALFVLAVMPAPSREVGPADVAFLVSEKDVASILEPLRAAVTSGNPLVRATAARVIGVREVRPLVAALRDQLSRETDPVAAREEIRTTAWLGNEADIDAAIAASGRWPASVDGDLAIAIARRGGPEAVALYQSKLVSLRRIDRGQFFRMALWGRPGLVSVAASRLLGATDAAGWQALLQESLRSRVALDAGVLKAALSSASEEIRVDTVWYVARAYAPDPSQMPQLVREQFNAPQDVASNREAFGRQLVARMLGSERKEDDRWLGWLDSLEADAILGNGEEPALYSWFTDQEFASRKRRCGMVPTQCAMPARLNRPATVIASQPVAALDFTMPDMLPAGLTSQLLTCSDGWLGVATVSVAEGGRVQAVDLGATNARGCAKALEAILRLSLPSNAAMTSPHVSGNVLLVRAARQPLCLDEPPPSEAVATGTMRVGGKVIAPAVVHRVEPAFPASARASMGSRKSMMFILESVISKEGCVRNLRVVAQTPYPEVNGAAVAAVAQWKFSPGMMDGEPVDVIFNLTVNFRTN
jgi:TonB family protein